MKGKFCESLIIIKHQEPSQDSIPPCLYLEFLIYLTMVSEEMAFPYGTSVKVLLRSNFRNLFKTPPPQSLILEDIRFLVDLEMVADEKDYPF